MSNNVLKKVLASEKKVISVFAPRYEHRIKRKF